MVNTKDFAERLHKILDYYDMSAASFADEIDVGRSSISHILSGRNKPSLDFVMKIIKAFPEVELYWLLNGKGSFPKLQEEKPTTRSPDLRPAKEEENAEIKFPEHLPEKQAENIQKSTSGKAIKKIVIFYSDGSFEAFSN